MRDDFRQAYRSFVHPLGRGSNRSVASDDMGWNARARIWNRHIVYLSADLNPLYLEGFKMTKTEDQIIAEAVRLTDAEDDDAWRIIQFSTVMEIRAYKEAL